MAGEINDRFYAMLGRLHLKERYDRLTEFAYDSPMKATFLGIVVATSILPLLLFLGFVISSLCFVLMGIIFIEGMALAIATVSLVFVLAGCISASLGFTAFVVGSAIALRFCRNVLWTASGHIDEYAGKEGRVGQMIRSCRAIKDKITSDTENKDIFEEPEKEH